MSDTLYNMKHLLRINRITWHDLSDVTGIPECVFQNCEHYFITDVPIEIAAMVADAFHVSLYELIHTNMWCTDQENNHLCIANSDDWTKQMDDELKYYIRCICAYIDECLLNIKTISRRQCAQKLYLMFSSLPSPSQKQSQKIDYQTLLFYAAKLDESAKHDGFMPFLCDLKEYVEEKSNLALLSYSMIYYNILRILKQIPEDIADDNRYLIQRI